MKRWFVGETIRDRQDEAALSVTPLGMEAYVPAIIRVRRRGHQIVQEEVPRFGCYIFVRFDRGSDPWPELLRGHGPVNSHFRRFLCNSENTPAPVPDRAMEAIMSWVPPSMDEVKKRIEFKAGDEVVWTEAGVRRSGYFVEYRGKRQFIRAWIFGSERILEVSSAQLEPAEAA